MGIMGHPQRRQVVPKVEGKALLQAIAPKEDIEDFLMELYDKRISKNEDPDKLRWGMTIQVTSTPKKP